MHFFLMDSKSKCVLIMSVREAGQLGKQRVPSLEQVWTLGQLFSALAPGVPHTAQGAIIITSPCPQ